MQLSTLEGTISSTSAVPILIVSEPTSIFAISVHSVVEVSQEVEIYFVPNNEGSIGTASSLYRKEKITLPIYGSREFPSPKASWVYSAINDSIQIKTSVANGLVYQIIVGLPDPEPTTLVPFVNTNLNLLSDLGGATLPFVNSNIPSDILSENLSFVNTSLVDIEDLSVRPLGFVNSDLILLEDT